MCFFQHMCRNRAHPSLFFVHFGLVFLDSCALKVPRAPYRAHRRKARTLLKLPPFPVLTRASVLVIGVTN